MGRQRPRPGAMIIDIHSHHPAPYPEGIVSCQPDEFSPMEGQVYSLGLHPWHLDARTLAPSLLRLEEMARETCVAAIGECGLDALRGAPMWVQVNTFKAQALIAEKLRKPLIIHDVRAHEGILGVHKDVAPSVPWILHGFRGKPSVAAMFISRGIALSFGEKFNAETLRLTPPDMIYAETDESLLPISGIITLLSESAGRNLRPDIERNINTLLRI